MTINRSFRYFFPAVLFGVFMLVAATLPTEEIEKTQESHAFFRWALSDYVLHFGVFAVFTLLLCYGYRRLKSSPFPFIRTALLAASFGLFIEIYQFFIPYRSFSLNDFAADIAGTAAALVFYGLLWKRI